MTKMTAWDRRVLRQMALCAWEQSLHLHGDAAKLQAEASRIRAYSQDRRAARQLRRQADHGTRAGGIGLVASPDIAHLVRLEELVVHRLPVLVGARDAETLLGFAVMCQPDVAVVDDALGNSCCADLALTLALYAPLTKVLWLTDDDDVTAQARIVGFDAAPHRGEDRTVLSWLERAPA